MKGLHWSRQAPTRCTLHALSDHPLRDIGLLGSGTEFALATGTVGQLAAIQPAGRRRWWKTRRGRALLVASVLSMALGLTFILVIASAVTFHLVDVPIVDMRL